MDNLVENVLEKYQLNKEDKDKIKKIIIPIYEHEEFQKRMNKPFIHQGSITLGEHILEDAVVTYKLSKKYVNKHMDNYDINLAIKIAMFHDLYTVPWQNNDLEKVKHFFNKHGFTHPIEACINAYYWYPEFFKDNNDSVKLIDGIIHHMYPLPVRACKGEMELKNEEMWNNLPYDIKDIIINSTKRKRIMNISISKSKYKEGIIMSKADKKVARSELKSIRSIISLFTGHYIEK